MSVCAYMRGLGVGKGSKKNTRAPSRAQWREACEEDWASDLRGGDPKEGLTLEGLVMRRTRTRTTRY